MRCFYVVQKQKGVADAMIEAPKAISGSMEPEPSRGRLLPSVTTYGPPGFAIGGRSFCGKIGSAQTLPSGRSRRTAKLTVTTMEGFILWLLP